MSAGCAEVLGLDLSSLPHGSVTWHSLSSTPARGPLSSEGISLLAVDCPPPSTASSAAPAILVAFGGYNGKYHASVSVTSPQPLPALETQASLHSLPSTRSIGLPAENGDTGAAHHSSEVEELREQVQSLTSQLAAARAEAEVAVRGAATAAASDAHELALLRKQLATSQAALETASKVPLD